MRTYRINDIYNISPITRNRLRQLFNKFIWSYTSEEEQKLYDLITQKETDNAIIDYIISRKKNKTQSAMDQKKRGDKFANEWTEVVGPQKVTNYLDIGCNNGIITVPFGNKLKLDSKHIHGIDITNFEYQTIKPIPGFIFHTYDGYHIPYEDNTFDFITCAMVLHHVKYPNILLPEIRRVMKDNSHIMIKEHNCYSESLEWLIELEHMLYEVTDSDKTFNEFKKTYYQKLFDKKELKTLMEKYGFEKIKINSEKMIEKYYSYNPTKGYYSLYVKKHI